ncbi:XdhC family protein [Hyunsoonleella pacifica]|uniref:XdhC/CoxI family protein n=1 Tax=Hyunsoonleella pacifica TaxID=1080224 RepID=A0A4Q9FQD1_9FLAO|nr:XdhC/CoxI family protein [Hyunsoonleella pacifica]TBN17463.1 XdhC/CoxI family protein [Hyunsoonleella pacifica]GGD11770.1 putative xanthine dehydrogenase subunit A [Hyunsoonleella pacifica]
MTHEFKHIINDAIKAKTKGVTCILASVVDLDGSSYRRPGVRMLILENGEIIGAVSGGCVEKEVVLQAQSVFTTGQSKMMTYDGRYRLGCEGILYILLEAITFEKEFEVAFFKCLNDRQTFEVVSKYQKSEGIFKGIGSTVNIGNSSFALSNNSSEKKRLFTFHQNMLPCFKLIIIGAEHDAVQLCKYAVLTGWEVTIVAGVSEDKTVEYFEGAQNLITTTPEEFDISSVDMQTAVVLMTHNFAYDLRYLVALHKANPNYIGLLGPTKRREDLLTQCIEYCPDISDEFLETIHGPAGLDIGSETPQEIAISIVSEILAVTRKRNSKSLRLKSGHIHQKQ